MNRSRLLLVASITVTFVLAAAAFRTNSTSTSTSATFAAGSLHSATPMLEPRSGHCATLLPDGKVLIAGGMRRNQDFYKSAELYDPATGKFQPTGEMSVGRVGTIAVLLRSGKVLIAGGWVGHGATDSAEFYDPATGKFTLRPQYDRAARHARALRCWPTAMCSSREAKIMTAATRQSLRRRFSAPDTLQFQADGLACTVLARVRRQLC